MVNRQWSCTRHRAMSCQILYNLIARSCIASLYTFRRYWLFRNGYCYKHSIWSTAFYRRQRFLRSYGWKLRITNRYKIGSVIIWSGILLMLLKTEFWGYILSHLSAEIPYPLGLPFYGASVRDLIRAVPLFQWSVVNGRQAISCSSTGRFSHFGDLLPLHFSCKSILLSVFPL